MESRSTHKVRLVRCPRCRTLLPEPQGIPVYKCGGCETVLQVKNRKNGAKGTTPGSHETDASQMKELDHVHEVGESSSSSQRVLPSSGKGSIEQNGVEDKKISKEHVPAAGESSSSSQKAILPSSNKCSLHQYGEGDNKISRYHVFEVGECSSSGQKAVLGSLGERSLDQNEEGDQRISKDHVSEVRECSSSIGETILQSSSECSLNQNEGEGERISRNHVSENEESSSPSETATLSPSANCSLDQNEGGDQEISANHVSEGGESSTSSQIAILQSLGECSLDQNGGDKKLSSDHVSEGEESSSPREKATLPSSSENSLDQNGRGDKKISIDLVSEDGESSSLGKIENLPSSGKCSLDQNGGGDLKISRDCSTGNSEDVNLSDGDRNSESDHNESQVCIIKQPGVSNEFCLSNRDADHENEELSQFDRTYSEVELNEMSSLQAEPKLAVDINTESDSTMRSLTVDNIARREFNSTVATHKPAMESFSSDILFSSPEEQPKQCQTNVNLSYERGDFFSPRSEVSSKTENYRAKYPRFRSSYKYDGSVSSFDGTDDQVTDEYLNLHRRTFKAANSVIHEEQSRRDKLLGNSIRNGKSEMQHQARNFSSAAPDSRRYTRDYSKWEGDELLGSTGHGPQVTYGTRLQDDEFPSLLPFYQRDYAAGYEIGSTSSPLQDEFHHSSSEQEKIKLLRLVHELQDQINKTCNVNGKANRRVPTGVIGKEKYIPAQNIGEIPEDEFFHDLNHHRYPEMCMQERNWPHQHKVSRIPFSGESTDGRQHMNYSCMHCYPQDLQCSAPPPPPFLSHNKEVRTFHFHPGYSCYNSYCSHPSSPQHFADSEFPIWHHETNSDHQRHEDHHMKEKLHLVKRHLRPIAGGAPFITCYNCLNPLQLPADFIVFKRRFHLLRCGACTKVLKFSLERRTHIVPYKPEAEAPPLDDYSDAINRRNSVSSSRGNGCSPSDPVSCSDDYGVSHCKSYSTDEEPVILAPFHNGKGNTEGKNLSLDSSKSMKERPQLIKKLRGYRYKNPVETQAPPLPSSSKSRLKKVSSEIEDSPARTGSPLHRLMGYSSPSQVLRGSDDPSTSGHAHTTRNGT